MPKAFFFLLFLSYQVSVTAQEFPAINDIPDFYSPLQKIKLSNDKTQLEERKLKINKKIESFNTKCGMVPESKTELLKECEQEDAQIDKETGKLINDIKKFNAGLSSYFPGSKEELNALQKSIDFNFSGESEKDPVIKPRYVSAEQYESAKKEIERLEMVKKKMEEKISEVEKWKTDQNAYYKEFDDMRAKAATGYFSDILKAIPIGGIVGGMSKIEKYKDYSEKLNDAYKVIKATNDIHNSMAASTEALFEKDDNIAFKKMIEADFKAQSALLAISALPEGEKKWFESVAKLYEDRGKLMFWNNEQKENQATNNASQSFFLTHENELKEGLDLVGVFFPPAKIGLAVEGLVERGVTLHYTKEPIAAISNALNQNAKAGLVLKEKIESINAKMIEQKRLISMYQQQ